MASSFKATKRLLGSKRRLDLIDAVNEQCLKQVIMLLKPFKHIATIIQCGNKPSLRLVSMCFITLKEVLGSYELLKRYNADNAGAANDGATSWNVLEDDDLEHQLPGNHSEQS